MRELGKRKNIHKAKALHGARNPHMQVLGPPRLVSSVSILREKKFV